MNIKHILAIFKKTYKDMSRNKRQLMFFLLFPIMANIYYITLKDGREFYAIAFLPVNILFCSMNIMAAIIAEEKETGTLRSLMFANIKPVEYFIGNSMFIIIATTISSSLFIPLIKLSNSNYIYFYIFIILSSICSIILGATIGIIAKNQMNANALCSPVTLIIGMLPTFGAMNKTIRKIADLFYTTKFANIISQIINNEKVIIDYKTILTYLINFIICLFIFNIVYKRKKLDD